MKIAYLTDTYQPEINGIVTSITNFTEHLVSAGHEVLIIAPKYDQKKDHPIPGMTIKRYPSFSFATNKNTHIAYPALIGIIRDLRDFKPDVVHVQTPMSIGVAGVMAARILKIKLVQTYHTYLPDFMVYVSPYNLLGLDKASERIANSRALRQIAESEAVVDLEKFAEDQTRSSAIIKGLDKQLARIRGPKNQSFSDRFAWDFTRFLYGRSDMVLTPSRALATLLRRHRVSAPVLDLSNGIDFSSIKAKESYDIQYRILNAGRLGVEGKNVDVVIKAFAIARKSCPKLTLDISGDGPAAVALKQLAVDLGVSESVRFLGFIPRADLLREYPKHDGFVTASTMETQGLVLLEAMAAGLPVIGVDALAVPEVVVDGKNGYLVEPNDPAAMAEAILNLVKSTKLNEKLGKKSLELASKHDLSICADKLQEIYRQLFI